MLGTWGVGSWLAASARIPIRNPGRVTRRSISFGSWQSTHDTGCAPSTCVKRGSVPPGIGFIEPVFTTSACAAAYGIFAMMSKPLNMSPPPRRR